MYAYIYTYIIAWSKRHPVQVSGMDERFEYVVAVFEADSKMINTCPVQVSVSYSPLAEI